MKIAVIGTGYVGLVTGTCLAESGNTVVCADVDGAKVNQLKGGTIPIYEPGLEELVRRNAKEGRLSFTTSVADAAQGAQVAFIAVGTPPGETGEADLTHVLNAGRAIAEAIRDYAVVVVKSTVPVGSSDKVAEALKPVAKAPFDVASNPEFLKEGAAVDDFMRPDRIVIGTSSDRARAVLADLYAPFVRTEQPILFMDPRSAELTKYAANAMLATRISFINDIAALCERTGADIDHVRRGMGADKRIGYPFLFPGVGFGGSCLPGNESVLVRHGARTELLSLEEAFGRHAKNALSSNDAVIAPEGMEVLAWKPGGTAPEFLPVTALTRRHFKGELVEVRTKMGRRLRSTPDHPFFVTGKTSAGPPMVKEAAQLTTEDYLPLAQGFPSPAEDAVETLKFQLWDGMKQAQLEPEDVIVRPADYDVAALRELGAIVIRRAIAPVSPARARSNDILRAGAMRLDEAQIIGLTLIEGSASTVRNGTYAPTTFVADERFWRIFGLYLSEGCISRDGQRQRILWSFHPRREADLAEEVASYWRDLGVKVDVRQGTTALKVTVSSRLLAGLWLGVLKAGRNCYEHRIPDQIWNRPIAHKRALLTGLWHGDGSWSMIGDGPSVAFCYGTASPALADGVLRLLGDLGVVARLRVGRTKKSTCDNYWITISGADQIEGVLDLVPEKDHLGIQTLLSRQTKRIAPTGYVRCDMARVRVTDLQKVAYEGPVYSMEVPGAHTFVTTGGLVTHNCFPKDLRALMSMARHVGLDFDILRGVERVNERQKRLMVEKAQKHFGNLGGKTFAVWGLSFKPKTDDMREAPSVVLVEALLGAGAKVRAHDPVAEGVARRLFENRVELTREPYAAAEGADALFLVTEWNEFRRPDFIRLRGAMRQPVLFDGRNVWDAEKARALGFTYYGVGRSAA